MSVHCAGSGWADGGAGPGAEVSATAPGPAPTIAVKLTEAQIRAVAECVERDLARCAMDGCDTCDEAADATVEMQWRLGLFLIGRDPNPKVNGGYQERRLTPLQHVVDGFKRAGILR